MGTDNRQCFHFEKSIMGGDEHISSISTGLLCFYVLLCLMNVFLHLVGLYILWSMRSTMSIYKTYIVSLSTTEFLTSLAFLAKTCLLFIESPSHAVEDVIAHADIVRYTVFSFCYYTVKIYLLFDQLACIFIAVRYKAHWTKKKVNSVLNGTWFVGVVLCFAVIFGIDWHQEGYADRIHKILLYADVVSISIFVLSFLVLVCKVKPSSICPESNGGTTIQNQFPSPENTSSLKLLFRTNYAVTFAFHVMLLVFHFTADILILYTHQNDSEMTPLYLLSYLGDGFAYIYLMPDLKANIKEQVVRFGCLKSVGESGELGNVNSTSNYVV